MTAFESEDTEDYGAEEEDVVDISSYTPAHFAPDADEYDEELPQYPDNVLITPD